MLTLATGLATAILIIIFSIGPAIIAKRFNPIGSQQLLAISPVTQALHESLTIVDLHADSLLWGRGLSKLSDYGHIDIPRLLQGDVAFQISTAVTKVPTPLLLESNSSDSDSIVKLGILRRWPIPAWFNLAKRAIYQAKQLQALEKKVPNTFRIIKTQQDLHDYLAQKEAGQPMTAGVLGLEGAQAFEGKINNVNRLYEVGFRIVGLSHFFDNEVAGSAHGVSKGGLTTFGENTIKRYGRTRHDYRSRPCLTTNY